MLNRGAISSKIGSMYMYEADHTIELDDADTYQAVTGFLEGSVIEGFTFLASATGVITDTENNGGVLRCTDAAHGLTTGQYVTLHGMGDSDHDSDTRVTVISASVFDCDDIAYNSADDTGKWTRGSSLTVNTGGAGNYQLSYSASVRAEDNGKRFKIELVKNTSHLDESATWRKIANGNDVGNLASGCTEYLADGDVIWVQVKNTDDASDLIYDYANVNIFRV